MAVALIIALFGMALFGIQQDSLWLDEGWTAWAIRDDMRSPQSLREAGRYIRDSLLATLRHVRDDVHPPLYFVLLDGWSLVMGRSEMALRLPSVLMGPLALAGLYVTGASWFNRRTALIAVILLGTSGFFLYYSREARMYTLYLALTTLATAAYSRWWHRPHLRRGLLYGLLMALALYTHYVSALVFLAHGVHRVITMRTRQSASPLLMVPYLLAFILLYPWLPVAFMQLQAHPGGAAADFLPTNGATIAAIWLLLTSGYWLNFILPFLLGRAVPDAITQARTRHAISLLLLWLLLPVVVLLLINRRDFAIFQMRYIIAVVPAWSLLLAYAIDKIRIPFLKRGQAVTMCRVVQMLFVLWLAYTQASMLDNLWPARPRWREAVMRAAASRSATQPGLVHIAPQSPVAYYNRVYSLADGISIDVGWRRFSPDDIRTIAAHLDNHESVWAILPMQDPQSWDAVAALSAGRGVGYRDSVQGTIFYRFDEASADRLAFQFGTDDANPVAVDWTYRTYEAAAGDRLCPDVPLMNNPHTVELALIRGYDEVVAAATADGCLVVPDTDAALHLRLALMDDSGRQIPLVEEGLYWGDHLFMGVVRNSSE